MRRSRYTIPQNAIETRVDDYCLLTEFMKDKYKYFRTECTITCRHRELVPMNIVLFPFHQKACHLYLHFMASINKLDNGTQTHPDPAGKNTKMAFSKWKSVNHTALSSFRGEYERHCKIDHDRQAEMMPNVQCTVYKVRFKQMLYCTHCVDIR